MCRNGSKLGKQFIPLWNVATYKTSRWTGPLSIDEKPEFSFFFFLFTVHGPEGDWD